MEDSLKELDKGSADSIRFSPMWRTTEKLLRSAPGSGPILSMTLLSGLPELGALNRGETAAPVGLAPCGENVRCGVAAAR